MHCAQCGSEFDFFGFHGELTAFDFIGDHFLGISRKLVAFVTCSGFHIRMGTYLTIYLILHCWGRDIDECLLIGCFYQSYLAIFLLKIIIFFVIMGDF